MRISKVWQEYVTSPYWQREAGERRREAVQKVWQNFAAWCGGISIGSLTSTMVATYLDGSCAGRAPKTYDEHLRIIRQVLRATMSRTGLVANPALEVPIRKKRSVSRKPYTREEVEKILSIVRGGSIVIPYHYKTHGKTAVVERTFAIREPRETEIAIMLGAFCGMRLGDALNVTTDDVHDGMLTYTPHKTQTSSGVEVTVPIIDQRLIDLIALADGALTPHLAEWHRQNPSAVCRHFSKIFEAAGFLTRQAVVQGRMASTGGFHALRHSYVTWCAEAGVPIDVVSSCIGHTSTITTRIYNHVSNRRKAMEMQKIFG